MSDASPVIGPLSRGRIVLFVGAAALAAACGGGGDDAETVSTWCSNVERLATFLDEHRSGAPDNFDDLEAAIDDGNRLESELIDGAPGSISDEVATMFATDTETLDLDEQEAYDEAQSTVNDFIRDECRLDIGL